MTDVKPDLKVGDTLYVPSYRRYQNEYTLEIVAVGRKWLTCLRYGRDIRVDRETLLIESKIGSPDRAYRSLTIISHIRTDILIY